MVFHRIKTLGAYLFLISIGICFITSPALAASRGILVKTQTSSGAARQIKLYSGYHALVVGCGQYTQGWPPLPNPVKDAKEVAALLKGLGWRVDVLMDPQGVKLRRELNRLVTGVGRKKDKAILVWFSGHGQTIEEADGTKLGYLVPVDAPDPDKDLLGFMERAISMRQIETVSKQIRSKHVLMAFDSCFSGAIFQMVRTKPSPYIQQKVTYPVRQFITAGREDEQVPDRSVFKEVFIQGIKEGFADLNQDRYITGEELGSYLQERVTNYSRNAQHPQFGKINNPRLDKGDFVFVLDQPQQTGLKAKTKSKAPEDQTIDRESQQLASIPKEVKAARVSLRKEPRTLKRRNISSMLLKYGFFDNERNPAGNFKNEYRVNPDGTITDLATGLVWQKSGSPKMLSQREAIRYVKELNKKKFAGHADWRLPTTEELASLLTSTDKGLFINAAFDMRQKTCWSADDAPYDELGHAANRRRAWVIDFFEGKIGRADWTYKAGAPQYSTWASYEWYKTNHVRAVRSLE